jgi:hypothetical protein
MSDAQWAADPFERFPLRFYDGTRWTEHVSDADGSTSIDWAPLRSEQTSSSARPDRKAVARFASAGMDLWFSSQAALAGGHPRVEQPIERANVALTDQGIMLFGSEFEVVLAVRWSEVQALYAEDENAVTSRLTATRVVFLGFWSLLAKKKIDTSFLTIGLADGPLTLAVIGTNVYGLRSLVDTVARRAGVRVDRETSPGPPAATPLTPTVTTAERLRELEHLRSEGLLTEEEYSVRRSAIINSL